MEAVGEPILMAQEFQKGVEVIIPVEEPTASLYSSELAPATTILTEIGVDNLSAPLKHCWEPLMTLHRMLPRKKRLRFLQKREVQKTASTPKSRQGLNITERLATTCFDQTV